MPHTIHFCSRSYYGSYTTVQATSLDRQMSALDHFHHFTLHRSAVTQLFNSFCLSFFLCSAVLNCQPYRENKRWQNLAAGFYCFLCRGPAHAQQSPCLTACPLSFLPSLVTPDWLSWNIAMAMGVSPVGPKSLVKKHDLNLTCTLERRRVMGEEFLEVEGQVTGF